MKKLQLSRILFLLILLVLAWWNGLVVFQFAQLHSKKNEFKQGKKDFLKVNSEIKKVANNLENDKIIEAQNELEAQIYKNFRVTNVSNAKIIGYLAKLATTYRLKSVRPAIIKKKKIERIPTMNWEAVYTRLTFKARYHEAARLINEIERSNYLVTVYGFQLKRDDKDPKGPLRCVILAKFLRLAKS